MANIDTRAQEANTVLGLTDRMMAVISGVEIAQACTATSLTVAAFIISMTNTEQERASVYSAFCEQVTSLLTPEWIEYIKANTGNITLTAPERRQ